MCCWLFAKESRCFSSPKLELPLGAQDHQAASVVQPRCLAALAHSYSRVPVDLVDGTARQDLLYFRLKIACVTKLGNFLSRQP